MKDLYESVDLFCLVALHKTTLGCGVSVAVGFKAFVVNGFSDFEPQLSNFQDLI